MLFNSHEYLFLFLPGALILWFLLRRWGFHSGIKEKIQVGDKKIEVFEVTQERQIGRNACRQKGLSLLFLMTRKRVQ